MAALTPPAHVKRPGWFTRSVMNRVVTWLSRRGVSLAGAAVLAVEGRKTGEIRRAPVNPLRHEGEVYLVAPRGHVQWTHNLRAAGGAELFHGKRGRRFTAVEVPDAEKPEILREYLRKWKWEIGAFFPGLGPDAPREALLEAAPRYPVFRLTYTD
ncbi:nitroreductase family deazaflavin-dependent oxidoreductase [Streptomyces albus]|uniref:nitroreductase family deazaflavin-dependent oxidoreductase n=1 Tax=Streptomyces albus TaxID=1888 RepID=UPI0033F80BC0